MKTREDGWNNGWQWDGKRPNSDDNAKRVDKVKGTEKDAIISGIQFSKKLTSHKNDRSNSGEVFKENIVERVVLTSPKYIGLTKNKHTNLNKAKKVTNKIQALKESILGLHVGANHISKEEKSCGLEKKECGPGLVETSATLKHQGNVLQLGESTLCFAPV